MVDYFTRSSEVFLVQYVEVFFKKLLLNILRSHFSGAVELSLYVLI